ncbi:MAG: FKBP-type peptidyl-prolyl cis-trans isomerase [Planctomycetaceae bacterium]
MLCRQVVSLVLLGISCLLCGCGASSPIDQLLASVAGPVDADAPEEFTTTASGLKYRILRKGDGEQPTLKDKVEVKHAAWFDNGRVFDATYDSGQQMTLPMDDAVLGLSEGLQMISEGGMIELEVPGKLGYGSQGSGKIIPPNATLHYLVELIRVIPPPKPGPVDADAPEELTTTESGLKYRIRRKGDGKKPKVTDAVTVHYKGWLDDETVFDSSYDRGESVSFPMNGVIKGWTEGMQLVGEGGMIELVVPGKLGYGPQGHPPQIPPNATLHFLIELIEIVPPQQ